ncbi:DUF3455 domain-containing protein [Sorangium sp. So ce1000]|uniref:DUF3455 domain-containing protein n=1 Tax=Sorangium sp. So ce1000 TaxID=3133325 RepID=UPI003F5FF06C
MTTIAPFNPVPPIPSQIDLPEKKDLITVVVGVGFQLYQYQRQTDGTLKWIATGVDAKLFGLYGDAVGTHTTGPQWVIHGQTYKGTRLSEINANNPTSIPWLLLRVTERSTTENEISYIQRVYTAAGLAPPDTVKPSEGTSYRSAYTAYYLLWGTAVVSRTRGL